MWQTEYQEITITLSPITHSRLSEGFSGESRLVDNAIEKIRFAIFELFPVQTREEQHDESRLQGGIRFALLVWYDLICFLLLKLIGRQSVHKNSVNPGESFETTLRIPIGLMKWIEAIANKMQMNIPEATVYAIEYGIKLSDSRGNEEEQEKELKQMWRDIWRAVWSGSQ